MIRCATANDAQAICDIYNPYVLSTTITFETDPVSQEEMRRRIAEVQRNHPWLVWEQEQRVLGYCYATKWRDRFAYRHSVESTIYLLPEATGQRIGSQLFRALLDELPRRGCHAVMGGIALPNDASITLHEELGFQKVAHFRRVGNKFDQWIDVAYWQLLL